MQSADRERVFDVSARDLWNAAFFVDDYVKGIYAAIDVEITPIEFDTQGEWPNLSVVRKQVIEPERNIPVALHKLVRGATRVREEAIFDGANKSFQVRMHLPVIGKRVDFHYRYTWEELSPTKTKMIWHGEVDARLPLLKKRAESFLIGDLEKSVLAAGDFTEKWFQEHPPAGA